MKHNLGQSCKDHSGTSVPFDLGDLKYLIARATLLGGPNVKWSLVGHAFKALTPVKNVFVDALPWEARLFNCVHAEFSIYGAL